MKGIARYLGERGPWSIYHEPCGLGGAIPDWLRRWRGDGVIARVEGDRTLREVKKPGRPVVGVLGEAAAARIPLVHVDDVAIAELAAEHLLSLGLRQFAYCGIAHSTWSARRRSGYEAYIRARGYSCATFEWPAAPREAEGWELAQNRLSAWLETLPMPVGIMVCSDQRGVAVLDACRRVGIAVPEQTAVIGFDNDDALCSVCDPP